MSIWILDRSGANIYRDGGRPKIITSTMELRAVVTLLRREQPYGFVVVLRCRKLLKRTYLHEIVSLHRFEGTMVGTLPVITGLPTRLVGDYQIVAFHCSTRQERDHLITLCTSRLRRGSFQSWCRFASVVELVSYRVDESDE